MSISPSPVRSEVIRDGVYSLNRFSPVNAGLVASWAPTALDLFWLAPKTFPPLTAAKVIAWTSEDSCPFLLQRDEADEPLGYVELNPMPGERQHLWIGHCVIATRHRGEGLGRIMVSLLLRHAFGQRRADRVSLIVFPENLSAVSCYRSCGFSDVGTQTKFFHPTGRHHAMLQMSMERSEWAAGQD